MLPVTTVFSGNTGEHVFGVCERLLVDLHTTNHTRDFGHAFAAGERTGVGRGDVALAALGNLDVMLALRCHLRQVGDAQRLVALAQRPQLAADDLGDATAHADVDFIEDQCRHTAVCARHDLDREADARELATRGDFGERFRRLADVRAYQEFRALEAVAGELALRQRLQRDLEAPARYAELLHARTDGIRKFLRRLRTLARDLFGDLEVGLAL